MSDDPTKRFDERASYKTQNEERREDMSESKKPENILDWRKRCLPDAEVAQIKPDSLERLWEQSRAENWTPEQTIDALRGADIHTVDDTDKPAA